MLSECRSELVQAMRYLRQRGRASSPQYAELTEQLARADRFADSLQLAFEEKFHFPPPDDFENFDSDVMSRASEIFEKCFRSE